MNKFCVKYYTNFLYIDIFNIDYSICKTNYKSFLVVSQKIKNILNFM